MRPVIRKETILEQFSFDPTDSQELAIEKLIDFLNSRDHQPLFLLKGYAGTGKTTLVSALIRALRGLNIGCTQLAPTGRAAKVMMHASGFPAFTIHKWIYSRRKTRDGFFRTELKPNFLSNSLFIVDEASMISGNLTDLEQGHLLDDLIEFVYQKPGNALVLIGDGFQLPPVGTNESPALSPRYLKDRYPVTLFQSELTDVVRQAVESGILSNATQIRSLENFDGTPTALLTPNGIDVIRMEGQEAAMELGELMGTISGPEEGIVITRSNKRANLFSKQVRNTVHFYDSELNSGDYLMVVRNNYHWIKDSDKVSFIANGDLLRVERYLRQEEMHGLRFADAEVSLLDYPDYPSFEVKLLLDSLHKNSSSLSDVDMRSLYNSVLEDYADKETREEVRKAIQEDPYYNALQVKYAYAVTCHKSQGGQWPLVVIDFGWLPEDGYDEGFYRWLYTAVTRATEKLYLFGFPDELFLGSNR